MVLPKKYPRGIKSHVIGAAIVSIFLSSFTTSLAQGGPPLPGASQKAPLPGANAPSLGIHASSSLVPGMAGASYDKLPINAGMASARLDELRALMPPASRPKDFQDAIGEYCDWLNDIADAHWKLAQTFAKADATKAQAESERQLCFRFGALKRQAMLLKAEFLIKERRYPEALGPLVDIVAAEPRTETGQRAYQLLQDIGFSDPSVTAVAGKKSPPAH